MSMLSDFLKEHQISKEALLKTSRGLETLGVADRKLSVARAGARRSKKTYAELSLAKPNSLGRGLSEMLLDRALAGTPVSRLARHKIARAVNAELRTKKASEVDWRPLFADAKVKKPKKKKKK